MTSEVRQQDTRGAGMASGPTTGSATNSEAGMLAAGICIAAVALWIGATWAGTRVSSWLTPQPEPAWHPRLAQRPAGPVIEHSIALQGRDVFERACAQCHASSGQGKQGLGKDLVRSDFLANGSDADMVAFVLKGRPIEDPLNTTKVLMPPKGGIDSLTESDLSAVVAYMRGMQDPRRLPALPAWAPAPIVVTEKDKADAMAAAGGDAELAEYIASGSKLFAATCIACHGPGGTGVKGNGKALVNNEFVQSLNDDQLLAFIQRGRDPSDPKNSTGIGMPAKGGNPALSEDDLLDIISYLRSLQPRPARAATGS
jgi:mono/diheme cytochrome c family protein